jgi:hypothetical protein
MHANTSIVQASTAAAALSGILAAMPGTAQGKAAAVPTAPAGSLIIALPAGASLGQLHGARVTALSVQAGLPNGTYGLELVQDALSSTFPNATIVPLDGNILATATA